MRILVVYMKTERAEPAVTAQRLDGVPFEFRVASSAWLISDRWPKESELLTTEGSVRLRDE